MDLFARTYLPAAIDAGLTLPAVLRHLDPIRRCLGGQDAVLLVGRCDRPRRRWSGEYLLAVTRNRLVLLRRGVLRRQARVHLDTPIHELSDVHWAPEPGQARVQLTATAADGVPERFLIRARNSRSVGQLDAALGHVFRPAPNSGPAAVRAPVHSPNTAKLPR